MRAQLLAPLVVSRSAFASDDDQLFEAAYLRHRETVFRYLRARCPDNEDALDLTALTFERALIESRRKGLPGPALPWLLRTARNLAIDRQRRGRTRRLLLEVLGRVPVGNARSAEADVLARQGDPELRTALMALPEAQRDALSLRYGSDLSVHDVASLIGKSEAATQKLISRGLGRLKEAIHE